MLLSEALTNELPNLFNTGKYMLNYGLLIDVIGIDQDFINEPIILILYNNIFDKVQFRNEGVGEVDEDVHVLDIDEVLEYIKVIFKNLVNA